MSTLMLVSQFLSVTCCALFTGAAIYVNLVEHPARLECGTALAATVFPPSYKRAAMLQAPLALLGFLFSIVAYFYGSSVWWLIGGFLLFSVVPFTFIAIMPTNKKLLNPRVEKESKITHQLLLKWGKLHGVRSILSLISFLIFVVNLVFCPTK